MKHLSRNVEDSLVRTWCKLDLGQRASEATPDDPRVADCVECLRMAASYGAAAAMRCAAVEAAEFHVDEETAAERDAAVAALTRFHMALASSGFFVCTECQMMQDLQFTGFEVGPLRWCKRCAAARGRVL